MNNANSEKMRQLKIIDETITKSYGFSSAFTWLGFIGLAWSTVPLIIVGLMGLPIMIGVASTIALYLFFVYLWVKDRNRHKKMALKNPRIASLSDKDYSFLKSFITRYGNINSYASTGYIAEHDRPFGFQDPLEPMIKYRFIKLSSDNAIINKKEKALVERIFDYDRDSENIIWFSPKDRKPLQVTFFTNDDGTRMKFRHGYHSQDGEMQAIEIIEGEVVLHIYDKIFKNKN